MFFLSNKSFMCYLDINKYIAVLSDNFNKLCLLDKCLKTT